MDNVRFNRNVIDFVIYFTKFIFIFGIKNNLIVKSLKFIYSRILMFSKKDIIVLGMMVFALFLGAGNIIFPPMEGYTAGNHWATASMGFVITGVLMPFITLVVVSVGRCSLFNHSLFSHRFNLCHASNYQCRL